MGDTEYLRCIEDGPPGRPPFSAPAVIALGAFLAALLWAVLGFGSMPQDINVRDRVDLIEVNHFHDSEARLVFDQVIFYEWSPAKSRHQVQAWRLLKSPRQYPRRDYRVGDYVTRWTDGETDREVRAATIRETWTQHDPELLERAELAKEKRKELGKR
jgi:hypothetical protein